jgi:RNA polymerase sigma-70 factor (ECF subfamily)
MRAAAGRLALPFARDETRTGPIDAEFDARLADSATLAYRVAYGVVRNALDAEDITQEAFARAYRRFDQLRDRDRFRSWLVRVTWRIAVDHCRSTRRRQVREHAAVTIEAPRSSPDQEASLLAEERRARLWEAIDSLPEKLRVTLVLSAIDGHGVRDVAALLGVAEGTVKWRLFEARRRLQEHLS